MVDSFDVAGWVSEAGQIRQTEDRKIQEDQRLYRHGAAVAMQTIMATTEWRIWEEHVQQLIKPLEAHAAQLLKRLTRPVPLATEEVLAIRLEYLTTSAELKGLTRALELAQNVVDQRDIKDNM